MSIDKTILITGASKNLGNYLTKHYLDKKYNVIGISKSTKSNINYNSYICDLSNANKTKILFKKLKKKFKNIDLIIHCASLTNAENSFSNKKKMFKNNLGCMKNVIDFCIENKSKLIHLSSTSVYGKQAKIVNEDDDSFLKPQSPYADIKLMEENILKKNKHKLKFMSFRFGTIAGISPGMRFHTAINKFCFNAAIDQKIMIYKTAYNQYRPYLSIKDAFKVFKFCIEKNMFKNDVFNALSQNLTVKQVVGMIRKYKKNAKIKFVNAKIMNQLSYHVDNKKLNNLGLKLNSNIERDIKETLKLFVFKNNEM